MRNIEENTGEPGVRACTRDRRQFVVSRHAYLPSEEVRRCARCPAPCRSEATGRAISITALSRSRRSLYQEVGRMIIAHANRGHAEVFAVFLQVIENEGLGFEKVLELILGHDLQPIQPECHV